MLFLLLQTNSTFSSACTTLIARPVTNAPPLVQTPPAQEQVRFAPSPRGKLALAAFEQG